MNRCRKFLTALGVPKNELLTPKYVKLYVNTLGDNFTLKVNSVSNYPTYNPSPPPPILCTALNNFAILVRCTAEELTPLIKMSHKTTRCHNLEHLNLPSYRPQSLKTYPQDAWKTSKEPHYTRWGTEVPQDTIM
jgi:hypothetical protein